ncbi:Echinoderm microtubule-associated protein-like 3, partial [Frankliniella fusca]
MLKCLGCARRRSQGSDDDDVDAAAKTTTSPSADAADTPSGDAAKNAATAARTPPSDAAEPGAGGARDVAVGEEPRTAARATLNALGLRVDASVDAELAELGMDATVLLEPLTPRSLMTSTPYPGKRASVVVDAVLGLPDSAASSPDADLDLPPDMLPALPPRETDGTLEPPATPVGRDELALRRHRFFADLLTAAQAQADHRVRFDPRGPVVAG